MMLSSNQNLAAQEGQGMLTTAGWSRSVNMLSMLFPAILLFTVLALVQRAVAQEVAGQEILTNASVAQMVQAHLGVDIIIEQIRSNPGNYALATKDLIHLKQLGVSDRVITAMQAKRDETGSPTNSTTPALIPNSPGPRPEASNRSGGEASGVWTETQIKDPMTDVVRSELNFSGTGVPNGRFAVNASCFVDNFGVNSVELGITSESRELAFKMIADQRTATSEQVPFTNDVNTTVSGDYERSHFDVRLSGESVLRYMESATVGRGPAVLFLSEDYRVAAHKVVQTAQKGVSDTLGIKDQDNAAGNLMEALLGGIGVGRKDFDNTNIQASDALRSDSMRIRFQFEDGQFTVLTLPIGTPAFRAFVGRCVPAANPSPVAASTPKASASERLDLDQWRDDQAKREHDLELARANREADEINRGKASYNPAYDMSLWHPSDGLKYGFGETIESREFKGSSKDFASVLPGFVQRAAQGGGLPPYNYEREISYALGAIETCEEITPQMAQKLPYFPGPEAMERTLGSKYRICGANEANLSLQVRAYDGRGSLRGLVIYIAPAISSAAESWKRLNVLISLARLPGDSGGTQEDNMKAQDAYTVVRAVIDDSPPNQ